MYVLSDQNSSSASFDNLLRDKATAREHFRQARKSFADKLSAADKGKVIARLSDNLMAVTHQIGGVIASYQAVASEVPVQKFEIEKQKKTPQILFCFPKVEGEGLKFYKLTSPADLSPGAFNILEPAADGKNLIDSNQIECVLVPGVAFDQRGFRIGSGFGYYDRFLANFKGVKVGVGYSCQLSAQPLPVEEHDIRMDWIVCEDYSIRLSEDRKWN